MQVLSQRWASVFQKGSIRAQRYLERFGVSPNLVDLAPPSLASVKKYLQGLENSAPGPDGPRSLRGEGTPKGT
eukprot:2836060-Pyramimonas_sp.AAC.1